MTRPRNYVPRGPIPKALEHSWRAVTRLRMRGDARAEALTDALLELEAKWERER